MTGRQGADHGRLNASIRTLQRALGALDAAWWWGEGIIRGLGFGRRPQPALEPIEDVVQETLRPIEPSDAFRRSLRSDLAFAAHQRQLGLVVERPRPFREGIILGIVLSVVAVLSTTLIIALWPRQGVQQGRHP